MLPPDLEASPIATAVAPGKAILLGEHAVVYGRPALAMPVGAVETAATVYVHDGPLTVRAHFPLDEARAPLELGIADAPVDDPLATAVRQALVWCRIEQLPPWRIELHSSIPVARGMGSSAALAVATVRAVACAAGATIDDTTVAELSLEAERCTHGTPSGIDSAVIASGRPIRFESGQFQVPLVARPLTFLVADSGERSSTRAQVAAVRARYERQSATHEDWFDGIARLVNEALGALATSDAQRLGWLMNANHLYLQALGVSTARLDALVGAARGAGAFGAKLSGAGGGGIVLALVSEESAEPISHAMRLAGAQSVLRTHLLDTS